MAFLLSFVKSTFLIVVGSFLLIDIPCTRGYNHYLDHGRGLQYIRRQTYRSEYYPPQYNDYDYTYGQEDAQSWGPLDYLYEGLSRIARGIRRLTGKGNVQERQSPIAGLFSSGLWTVPVSMGAVAWAARDSILNLITEAPTTETPATAAPIPAKCTSISSYCGFYGNKCSSDDPPRCSCGTTGAQCSSGPIPYCYNSAGTQIDNDDSSTCKCGGTGASDSCLATGGSATAPLCGTSSIGTFGVCGKCTKVAGTAGDGDWSTQGSCVESTKRCGSDGSCQCRKSDNSAGDGSSQGSCGAGTNCQSTGLCS